MGETIRFGKFEWDEQKEAQNFLKHGVHFKEVIEVFSDPNRILAQDERHSDKEERLFCIGKVKKEIATVRFTVRDDKIRIIGAGFWRKGRKFYENEK